MASLPPETIQVKRKRGIEDGPVDFLQVEGHKRHRSVSGEAVWVYQRKQPATDLHKNARGALPVIRATEEGDESRPVKPLRRKPSRARTAETRLNDPTPVNAPTNVNDVSSTDQMRRFHLSIPDSSRLIGIISKKRSAPAVFVERTLKKARELEGTTTHRSIVAPTPELQEPEPETSTYNPAVAPVSKEPVKYKRPGQRARTTHTQELPKSLVQRDPNVDMDQMARDMDAFTLSHISQTIAKMERETTPRKNKYKPKVPAQRYAERHPEYAAAERERAKAAEAVKDLDAMDTTADDTSDDDYVMETYERVPASRLRDAAVPVSQVGLLVFDTEPDMVDFFYGQEGDSEDEFPEDEEDENCENYYTADYPDEDLAWEDEFDRNPYHFAGDRDEFDLENDDDDNGEEKFLNEVWERSGSSDSARGIK